MDQCERVTLSDNEPEVCIRQASKFPNNCFKRFCWTVPNLTSNIMYQISYILEILVVFKINGKMKKIKILDLQYNSYSNDF